jgi:hypothetical protein
VGGAIRPLSRRGDQFATEPRRTRRSRRGATEKGRSTCSPRSLGVRRSTPRSHGEGEIYLARRGARSTEIDAAEPRRRGDLLGSPRSLGEYENRTPRSHQRVTNAEKGENLLGSPRSLGEYGDRRRGATEKGRSAWIAAEPSESTEIERRGATENGEIYLDRRGASESTEIDAASHGEGEIYLDRRGASEIRRSTPRSHGEGEIYCSPRSLGEYGDRRRGATEKGRSAWNRRRDSRHTPRRTRRTAFFQTRGDAETRRHETRRHGDTEGETQARLRNATIR